MEFPFEVFKCLPGKITILENKYDSFIKVYDLQLTNEKTQAQNSGSSWIYNSSVNGHSDINFRKRKEELESIVDRMGHASAKAQNLRAPISTLKKFLNSSEQKIYFIRDDNNNKSVIGFLKVGVKHLFICDDVGAHHELDTLCVLDFYVHESKQRLGFGHQLFNTMLQTENLTAEQLAIDRPSYKFLSFLKKHYGLENPIPQSNNFVVFPGFFIGREVRRPPIFLYRGNALQAMKSTSSMTQTSPSNNYNNKAITLNAINVPLCSSELKKNKSYYSSAASCLIWDEGDISQHKQNKNSTVLSPKSNILDNAHSNKKRINSPVQQCSDVQRKYEGWSSSRSTPCSLTPVESIRNCSSRRWDEMQSSWNIFGVKPIDYSIYQKQA